MGIVCVYLAEILLKLTLGPISTIVTNKLLWERSPFPRAGHIYQHLNLRGVSNFPSLSHIECISWEHYQLPLSPMGNTCNGQHSFCLP